MRAWVVCVCVAIIAAACSDDSSEGTSRDPDSGGATGGKTATGGKAATGGSSGGSSGAGGAGESGGASSGGASFVDASSDAATTTMDAGACELPVCNDAGSFCTTLAWPVTAQLPDVLGYPQANTLVQAGCGCVFTQCSPVAHLQGGCTRAMLGLASDGG
jgi:hypothetical protein